MDAFVGTSRRGIGAGIDLPRVLAPVLGGTQDEKLRRGISSRRRTAALGPGVGRSLPSLGPSRMSSGDAPRGDRRVRRHRRGVARRAPGPSTRPPPLAPRARSLASTASRRRSARRRRGRAPAAGAHAADHAAKRPRHLATSMMDDDERASHEVGPSSAGGVSHPSKRRFRGRGPADSPSGHDERQARESETRGERDERGGGERTEARRRRRRSAKGSTWSFHPPGWIVPAAAGRGPPRSAAATDPPRALARDDAASGMRDPRAVAGPPRADGGRPRRGVGGGDAEGRSSVRGRRIFARRRKAARPPPFASGGGPRSSSERRGRVVVGSGSRGRGLRR